MNDHFEGVQLDWNDSGYNHQQHSWVGDIVAQKQQTNPAQFQVPGDVSLDGQTQSFALTMGSNFAGGKGNATVYFESGKTRSGSAEGDPRFQRGLARRQPTTKAIPAAAPARASRDSSPTSATIDITIANAAGDVRNYIASLDQYNFAPTNYFQRPDTRYLANAFVHYDVLPASPGVHRVRLT